VSGYPPTGGVSSLHVAIGTVAIAVALNPSVTLGAHARLGTGKWRCAGVFAGAGIAGSLLGAEIGKAIDGQRLLALFGRVMVAVGLVESPVPLIQRRGPSHPRVGQLFAVAADWDELRRRRVGWLLRHRWWVPDRPWPDAGHRHAAAKRGRHLAGGHGSLRPGQASNYASSGMSVRKLAALVIGGGGVAHRRSPPER
jgi:hypothetical protein